MELFDKPYILLDGGMGTMLQAAGARGNPVLLNIEQPDLIASIHRAYVEAGSDIILTNTFGASKPKLEGSEHSPEEIIQAAVSIAKKAAGEKAKVALDIGPLGQLLEPTGTLSFQAAYELFRQQIEAGVQAGADLIFVETMTDLQEVRAALLAAKETCNLPVFVTMSFEPSGRSFTGVLPESFAIVAEGLGASAIGLNCSMGPREMQEICKKVLAHTSLPVILKPNAGLPDPETGAYTMTAQDFAQETAAYFAQGVKILGGCCGTEPGYVKALKESLEKMPLVKRDLFEKKSFLCSASRCLEVSGVHGIGERINPTGKPALKAALLANDMSYILQEALVQETAGAEILDINVGLPGVDEPALMQQVVTAVGSVCHLPLQIDSSNAQAIEAGLRHFNGKALLNSVNGEQAVLDKLLPIAKHYGAAVLGLTLDETGIPKTAHERLAIARRILDAALKHGIAKEDVYIDCLVLTLSAEPQSAKETLDAVAMVKKELGLKTVLGVSNISFGLPQREVINQNFLTQALGAGLNLPILDPCSSKMTDTLFAWKLLAGQDPGAKNYLNRFANVAKEAPKVSAGEMTIHEAIEKGLGGQAKARTQELLNSKTPLEIVDGILIPALDQVGQAYEAGRLFLPQLLSAAAAAGEAFGVISTALTQSGQAPLSKGTIILATVQGDIHDIGKNIVAVILENYGYRVVDLGRDVPPARIVEAAKEEGAMLIGLSALMTTTVPYMEQTIQQARAAGIKAPIMVGGAVLTPDYAKKIGADYYAKDAKQGAEIAKGLTGAQERK